MVVGHQKEEEYRILYLLKGNIIMTKNDIKKDSAEEIKDKKNEIQHHKTKNWTELIKPRKIDVVEGETPTFGSVVIEPLERGFGLTLGNALRRVLLSSLQGAAVTSVQIDGILHEFRSIPGMTEDITDFILNIKSLAIKLNSEKSQKMMWECLWMFCMIIPDTLSTPGRLLTLRAPHRGLSDRSPPPSGRELTSSSSHKPTSSSSQFLSFSSLSL